MYIKRLLKTTTSIQTKYLTSAPKFVPAYDKMNQSGRSMIEMLGVLAIIGVLSVGGLAAYEAAVERIEANNVFYDITTMKTRMETARLAALDAMPFAPNGRLNGMTAVYNNGRIDVTVPNVPFEICELLLEKAPETEIPTIEVSPDECVEDGLTDMVFSFAPEDGGTYALPISRVEPGTGGNTGGSTGGGDGGSTGGSTDEDDTSSVPCVNGTLSEDGQTCTCSGEWTGAACQKCPLSCVNGTPKSDCTGCDCDAGWGGENCDTCDMGCEKGYSDSACTKCICQGNWTGPRCNECSLDCGTETQGYDNTTCTACECIGNWDGENCSTCGLDCGTETQGTPDASCTACDCKEPWEGDDCAKCGLKQEDCPADKPKLDTDTCACVACPEDAPIWNGSECVSCTLECQNGGTLDLAACSCSCPSPWDGDDCAKCGLTCQNDGVLNDAECTCDCVAPWDGDDCTTCTLECQNGGTLDLNACSCSCPTPWTGEDCTTCPLTCAEGAEPNADCTACECEDDSLVYYNNECVPYDEVCGDTYDTCKAACPDSCTVDSPWGSPTPSELSWSDSYPLWQGYTCSSGECYCLARGDLIPDDIEAERGCYSCYDCFDSGIGVNGVACGGIGGFIDWGVCVFGECRAYFSGEIEDYPYDYTCASCFPSGTMISLADGTCKRVEDIDYDDELLVWDFDNGCFSSAKPLWIKQDETADEYEEVTFSNGATLGTINSHRVFNKEKGKFSYPITDEMPCYSTTFTADGTEVKVLDKKLVRKEVVYYNVITKHHMNCFANGILTSCRLSNLYPIQDMKYVKDNRALRPMSDYPDVPKEWYDGLRLAEQPVEINRDGDIKISETLLDYIYTCLRNDKCTLEDAVKVA